MSFELWLLIAFVLTIAEIVAPGTFLFFFGMGALAGGLATFATTDLRLQVLVFVLVSGRFGPGMALRPTPTTWRPAPRSRPRRSSE